MAAALTAGLLEKARSWVWPGLQTLNVLAWAPSNNSSCEDFLFLPVSAALTSIRRAGHRPSGRAVPATPERGV